MTADLNRLAMTVLQPGFEGTSAPDWMRRALGEGLGGAVLFARNVSSGVASLVASLRAENPGVVVAIDEEGGVVTRLEARTGSSFPGNRALGVVDSVDLTHRVAAEIGRLLAAADITLDYAPSVDVNANPANPVIGIRSFGPTPSLVSRHTVAWIEGLQGAGVAACAKHFPGHGDTVTDSHLALPTVHASRSLLSSRDLPPFEAAIKAGVQAIMCGHLLMPALDPALPATLSRTILTGLLREELGFDGMLVTDAIEMKAVAALYSPGEIAVRALNAGVDAICVGIATEESLYSLRDAIVSAVRSGTLAEERLASAANRVLTLSSWYAQQSPLRTAALTSSPTLTPTATPSTAPPSALSATSSAAPPSAPSTASSSAPSAGFSAGLEAARAALTTTGTPNLTAPPLVVEVNTRLNQAIDPSTPTGLAAALPGSIRATMTAEGTLPSLDTDRPVVLVVHDTARHEWVRQALSEALTQRPDAIVIETGIPDTPVGAAYAATHGISRVSAQAAAEWLTS
ncbi:glycoside hydrolase family 3 protein [Nonomuraea sp. NPDC050556]|uniref:glycoside hydrolase family 3 protein n=1 Tax=Nonomuraea sp. NPDC050556 TaxID=3364369 RepID=UPI00378C84B9